MNTTTRTESMALAAMPAAGYPEPSTHSASALMLSNESMDKLIRVAELMASGRATVPKHLQGSVGDCLAVSMQALQWGMNPFAVGQKTHIVNGALGYEAQLVNAVVQASGAIEGRFHYEYEGKSPAVMCRVGAIPRGEKEITWGEWLCESSVTTKNSPLWKTNPKQQLGYLQVKNWARQYAPGAILGVYTPDELENTLPRDMGTAEVVSAWTPDQITAADEAAAKGAKAYVAFWKSLDSDMQKKLAGTIEHDAFKDQAQRADASRTVDAAPKTREAAAPLTKATTTDEATGEIVTTVDDVRKRLNDAKNEDALYIAIDWADAIPEAEREAARPELEALFNTRLAAIRGE